MAVANAIDVLRDHLRRRHLRLTPEREAIVRAALDRSGHYGIDDLTDALRTSGHDVSKATVYRTLPLLVACGIIQATEISSDRSSFETAYGREHHDHLICKECGMVIEFHFEAFEMLERGLAAKYDFELTSHVHELIGVCGACHRRAALREIH